MIFRVTDIFHLSLWVCGSGEIIIPLPPHAHVSEIKKRPIHNDVAAVYWFYRKNIMQSMIDVNAFDLGKHCMGNDCLQDNLNQY